MSEWSDGYVSDVDYTYGYYGELNPLNLTIPFLMSGLAFPKVTTACELGFGQGLSINAHACATKTHWQGTDFNPAHVSFAKEIAQASGANINLFDQSFSEFCQRDDLPDFEFIGLHGIWSWISHENRGVLVDFIRRKLKVGGVLYISYNTLPGWSAAAPVRYMMTEHAHVMGARGDGSIKRVNDSVAFTKQLFSLCHRYQQQVPSIITRIEDISEQNPHYLAHEYFNRDWHPMYFSDMADWLQPAKVNYVCSANFLSDFNPINFTPEQSAFIDQINDPLFAESTKDFMLNKQFRKDYWAKGARRLSPLEHEKLWLQLRFIMVGKKSDIDLKLSGTVGVIDLRPEVFNPILELLSDNNIHDVESIQSITEAQGISSVQLFEALAILHGQEAIFLVQDDDAIDKAQKQCHTINEHILKQSLVSNDINYLVSPVTGGCIAINRISQLFLYFYIQGDSNKDNWVKDVWKALDKIGHRMVVAGKTIESEKENIAELAKQADNFESDVLPLIMRMRFFDNLSS